MTEGTGEGIGEGGAAVGVAEGEGAAAGGAIQIAEKPGNVPDKFWKDGAVDTEALLASYTSLESKLTEQGKAAAKVKTDAEAAVQIAESGSGEIPDDARIDQIMQVAGLDPSALGQHWIEKGELTAEDYTALAKLGYPRGVVDEFMTLKATVQKGAQTEIKAAAIASAGGEEQFTNLLAWAASSLTADEKLTFNAQLANPSTSTMAVEALLNRHGRAVGAGDARPLIEGGGASGSAAGPYTNQAEVAAAERDPKNDRRSAAFDPAFAAAHDKRLLASPDVSSLPRTAGER